MKIKKIKFSKYRCFNDAEFNFSTDGLNVVIGRNGSGKTELLFAIEWALYDLDFSTLQGKDNTAYALNSNIYRMYSDPDYDVINEASVTIEFSHPLTKDGEEIDTDFWLKKSAKYIPSGGKSKPREEIHSQLSRIDENGTKTPPWEDEKCADKIKKIIPKKILGGILFDGERMKALSNDDESSRNAIDGFISEITNIEQLTFTKQLLDQVRKDYSRDRSKLIRSTGDTNIAQKNDDVLTRDNDIEEKRVELKKKEEKVGDLESNLKNIKAQLDAYSEIQNEISIRNTAEGIKDTITKGSSKRMDALQDYLSEGYLLQCDDLFESVSLLVEANDVPAGLTIEAAKSILSRPTCICGEPWTPEHRKIVEDLIDELPPQNLNSSIIQTIDTLKLTKERVEKQIVTSYLDITDSNKAIEEQNRKIAAASKAIGSTNVIEIKEKENRRAELERDLTLTKRDIQELKSKIDELVKYNKKEREEIEKFDKSNKDLELVSKKEDFSKTCIQIIDEFIELSKKESLDAINVLIAKAFKTISEDYERGKRIYITQYVPPKYRIVTYYESEYEKLYKRAVWTKLFADYGLDKTELENDELKKELIILQASDSLSTGQRKIVTLSFVKAVTDFAMSKDSKNVDDTRVKREYPLFIDAPFSELSGENLSKFAAELPKFNEQSIVMMDPDIFKEIKTYFEKDIVKQYELIASKDQNNTSIKEVK